MKHLVLKILCTYLYSDFFISKTNNNFYLLFATSHLLNQRYINIPRNNNESHWPIIVILPHYQTVISINSFSYNNKSIVQFSIELLKTYATLHKKDFKAKNWIFFSSFWYAKTAKCVEILFRKYPCGAK